MMKLQPSLLAFATLMALFHPSVDAAAPRDTKNGDTRVRQVLELETHTKTVSVDRRQELQSDLQQDSATSSTRWQAGYVRIGEGWHPVEEAVATLALLDEYQAQRTSAPKTAEGQMQLANWCRAQKLPEQERAHLAQVMALAGPDLDPTAICQRMGYRQAGGHR